MLLFLLLCFILGGKECQCFYAVYFTLRLRGWGGGANGVPDPFL